MGTESFGNYRAEKHRRAKRKIAGIITVALIMLVGAYVIGILTSDSDDYKLREDVISQNHELKQQVEELTEEVEELKAELDRAESATPTPDPDERTSPRD